MSDFVYNFKNFYSTFYSCHVSSKRSHMVVYYKWLAHFLAEKKCDIVNNKSHRIIDSTVLQN